MRLNKILKPFFVGGLCIGLVASTNPITIFAYETALEYENDSILEYERMFEYERALEYGIILDYEPMVEYELTFDEPVFEPELTFDEPVYEPEIIFDEPVYESEITFDEPVYEPEIAFDEPIFEPEPAYENIPIYIPSRNERTPYRTTANLRIRTGPSLNYPVVETVSQGRTVYVLDRRDGEWFAVYSNGTYGYMNSDYLRYANAPMPEVQTVNGVELLPWSEARNLLPRNTPWQITDVRTGTVFWVQSFSHGNHADVETITQADTDSMFSVFGRWTWDTRPVWVTVDGRTFAASINGMPHAGSTISGNGMNGHVCIHFYGSRTHNGSRSHERDHQNSVQEAFRAAR